MNIEDTFNQSGLLYDRYLGDNLQLPYSETDIKIAPNDTVTADLINLKLSNLYQNFLYLYKNTKMASTLVPISALATAGVSANDTKFTWYRGLSTSQFQPFESLGNTLSALDNFKEIFALQNADLEQYTLLCTTGTELYAINSNNAETSLAIALSTLDYNTERITDKFFVDINSFALGPDNQLLLLDRGSNLLYKYDASGFLTNDNIAANRLFFKKFIGGYGDIQAKLKFNSPESVCMSNDFIYVLDSGNSCIKKYDKYLNWQYTYTLQRDFLSSYPFKLKVDSDSNFYVLTDDMFIFKYDNDFQNRYVISLSSIQVNGEVFKDMVFSSYDPNIFYVVTDQNVYKKFTSKPDDTTGKYLFYLHKFNNTQTLKAFVSLKATDGDNNILYSKNNNTAIFTSFYDNANLYDILTIPDFDVYDLEEIKLKEQENVQSWVLNKTFSKMILNHMRLRDQIIGKFVYILDARGNLVFNFNRYLTETEKDTINYQSNITSFVGKNEIIQNSVLNRCLVTVHKFQASILEVLREELKKELNKLVLLGAYNNVDTLADLRSLPLSSLQGITNTIQVDHHSLPSDTGGGAFVYNTLSTLADDNGAIIRPNSIGPTFPGRWIRQFVNGYAEPEMWGAFGNGINDDAPIIQAAIDYCTANSLSALTFSAKTYFLSAFAGAKDTTAFPSAKQNAGYNGNFYVAPKLSVGYWPDVPNRRVNITLLGTTGTVLCASNINSQKTWNGTSYVSPSGSPQTMITVRDQVSTFRLKNITLLWDGELTGQLVTGTVGLEVAGNRGGTSWGVPTYPAIKRDLIDVDNCTFNNCHRAINMGSTFVPGSGTQVANIKNSRFLYPKGSDSTRTDGGSQIVFMSSDTYEVNAMDNFVEGSTYMPVNSPNGLPLDGFIFYTGIKSNIYRNTFTRMAVESLYLGCNMSAWYLGGAGSYDITMPAVGGTITVQLPGITTNADQTTKFNQLTSIVEAGLTVGQYVAINWSGGGDNGYDGGIYQINSYSKATNPYSCTMTRVSGINGGGAWANWNTMPTGQHLSGASRFIVPYDGMLRLGVHSEVIDNVFEMSLATVGAAGARGATYMSHNPCIRADGGSHHVQGNKFSGTGMVYANSIIQDVHTNWLIEDNDFYYYNQDPLRPRKENLEVAGTVLTYANVGIWCSLSAGVIQNNRYHLWTDINQNTVYHVPSANPQIYVNCDDDLAPYNAVDGYTPVRVYTQLTNYSKTSFGVSLSRSIHRNNHTYISVPSAVSFVTDKQGDLATDVATATGNVVHGFDSVARLRSYGTVLTNTGSYSAPNDYLYNGLGAVVTNIGQYTYNSSSMATDNGSNVLKPDAINIANPGRWIAV